MAKYGGSFRLTRSHTAILKWLDEYGEDSLVALASMFKRDFPNVAVKSELGECLSSLVEWGLITVFDDAEDANKPELNEATAVSRIHDECDKLEFDHATGRWLSLESVSAMMFYITAKGKDLLRR